MPVRRVRVAALVGLIIAACLAGCAPKQAAPPDVPQYWQDQIRVVLGDSRTSEFVRQVLDDYRVTDAEFREAQDRFVQCMADRGWEVQLLPQGGYQVGSADGLAYTDEDMFADRDVCKSDTETVEGFYRDQKQNPTGETRAEQILGCLQAKGLADGTDLSLDQLGRMLDAGTYCPTDPAAWLCVLDPSGLSGPPPGFAEQRAQECAATAGVPSASPTQSGG